MTSVRHIKLALMTAALLMVAGGAASLFWAVLAVPADAMTKPAGLAQGGHNPATPRANGLPPLSDFAVVWERGLRGGVEAAPAVAVIEPPVEPAPATAPATPPALRLAGTVVEPGHCLAMFLTPDSKLEFKSIGEEAAGARIVAITTSGVTVSFNGATFTLAIDPAIPPPTPAAAAAADPQPALSTPSASQPAVSGIEVAR